jgi:hypothetical protein
MLCMFNYLWFDPYPTFQKAQILIITNANLFTMLIMT